MKKPRVLLFDIETSYSIARLWRSGEQYVSHDQLVAEFPSGIICVAYKWLGESKVTCLDWGIKKQNGINLLREFSKIAETADVVIGHNGEGFDKKHINTQLLLAGLPPMDWAPIEDTLKQFRRHFCLPSNKLDYIAQILFGERKNPMSFIDWVNVVEKKDPVALSKMIKYCKKDVLLLEKAYNKAKPFFTPKVNRSIILHDSKEGCPSCGSLNTQSNGYRATLSGRHKRMRCYDCGHNWKGKSEKLPK